MSVIGTDGIPPIQNTSGPRYIWDYDDLFFGTVGANKYVPRVNDLVRRVNGSGLLWYSVVSLDITTLIPVLQQVQADPTSAGFNPSDVLLGVDSISQSDTYRVLLDNSKLPMELNVDQRLTIGGTDVSHCRIFLGTDISDTGTVVSMSKTGVNNTWVDFIPMQIDTASPSAQKPVSIGYSNQNIPEGELVTCVFYTATESKISYRQCLVKHSSFIRAQNTITKTIQSIHLESPYISSVSSRMIEVPLDTTLESLNLRAVVTYSDGTVKRSTPFGNGFQIGGLELYTSSEVGVSSDVILMYRPSPNGNEISNNLTPGGVVVANYTIKTVTTVASYSIKLFPYPVHTPVSGGSPKYNLKWFAYSQDRDLCKDVTGSVVYTNGTTFNGAISTSNQATQGLSVRVSMSAVNASYGALTHQQDIDVKIDYIPFSDGFNTWEVGTTIGDHVMYGGVYATRKQNTGNTGGVYLSSGFLTLQQWLAGVYEKTYPIVNTLIESSPPTPTHVKLFKFSGNTVVSTDALAVESVLLTDGINTNFAIGDLDTIFIRFLKQKSDGSFQDLSLAAMLVKPYGT